MALVPTHGSGFQVSYKLYSIGRTGTQVLIFQSVAGRRKFLYSKRREAKDKKLQLLYKGTEYLRIYNNCVLYQEYDIKARKVDAREQAERFFKHG